MSKRYPDKMSQTGNLLAVYLSEKCDHSWQMRYVTAYDTPDGTCIRDYIHVQDLCAAHWLGLQQLMQGAPSARYNLGNGNGFSVREVIAVAEHIAGRSIPVIYGPRRPGDPARLVADATLVKLKLQWQPRYADLETIIRHAWAWETKAR